MKKEMMPARAVPPGRILRRELEARGWTQRDLAEILGRPAQAITEIVRGTKQITPETAVALGAAFGTSAEFWSNLEANYRLALAQQLSNSADDVSRKARLYAWAPVGELVKRGWVTGSRLVDELERSVCEFLGVEEVGATPELMVSLRASTCSDSAAAAARRAWLKRVERLADAQDVALFNPKGLLAAIPRLLDEAATADAVRNVPKRLAELGVRFVIVPHLPHTKLDGAAYTASRPVVALTLRYDRIDWFWFTLLHELAHIGLGHAGGRLDEEDDNDGIDEEEREANERAAQWCVPEETLETFMAKHPRPSLVAIQEFAASLHRHPGIVVGRLHRLERVPYSHFRGTLEKVRHHLTEWIDGAGVSAATPTADGGLTSTAASAPPRMY